MARYLKTYEGIDVSHKFEAEIFEVVNLYLDPPDGAVVLSFDEKTQVPAYPHPTPAADRLRQDREANP